MPLSRTTQDHDTIRKWAETRGAMPAEVRSTHRDSKTGILRFCFPKARNRNDENLKEISWDEFFNKFDQNGLELIYQEKTAGGARSNFNKLIYPESEHASGRSSSNHKSASASSHSNRSSSSSGRGASSTRSNSARSNTSSSRKKAA